MGQQVNKFGLEVAVTEQGIGKEVAETTVSVPDGAQFLGLGLAHDGSVAMLMLVDADAPANAERTFITVGNNVDLPDGVDALNFRGAVKFPNVSLSVFETTSVPAAA